MRYIGRRRLLSNSDRNYASMISRADVTKLPMEEEIGGDYDLSILPPTQPHGLTSGGPVTETIKNVMNGLRKYESKGN